MEQTRGRAEVLVGLVDGPVAMNHPDLAGVNVREIPAVGRGACIRAESIACEHGTFVAGILVGRRGSVAPAICPACDVLVRPIFAETPTGGSAMPSTTAEELARALCETIAAGAWVINLSAALVDSSPRGARELEDALDYAARRGVLVVAAAGNQGTLGSTTITRHPWVIPVVACDERGWPLPDSNLGNSIGRRGLLAPGAAITSLGARGELLTRSGSSVAAPFVTGVIALLWSVFPKASAAAVRRSLTPLLRGRGTLVPPCLDASASYQYLVNSTSGEIYNAAT